MRIHKEGHRIILIQFIIFIISILYMVPFEYRSLFTSYPIEYNPLQNLNWDSYLIVNGLLLIIILTTIWFFRVPKRLFERKDNIIYAPCDGKVVVIEKTHEEEYFKDQRLQISIFMSPLNVHNNLYPISGIVKYTKYHKGKYLVAWNPKSSTSNERNTIVIENNNISVLCRQIAGALARRIVSYAETEDEVVSSDELGFIKFGSRVDIFLPKNIKIDVKIGDVVKGGVSKIGSF